MNCARLEVLLTDYIDAILAPEERAAVEAHLGQCPECKELARDAAAAARFLAAVDPIEPPPELVTRILFHAPSGASPARPVAQEKRGVAGWLAGLLAPLLQPRFAMGMAMTILSFSMVGRIVGWQPRQLTMADLDPVKVWAALDNKVHRGYDRAMMYYENLRLVYEIRNRLREWSEQEEEDRRLNEAAAEQVPLKNGPGSNKK